MKTKIADLVTDTAGLLASDAGKFYFGPTFRNRVVALVWALDRSRFKGQHLDAVAADCSVSKQAMCKLIREARNCFNIPKRRKATAR